MIKKIVSKSADETRSFGKDLGVKASKGTIYALRGELGAGKTIIAKGIAEGLGITEIVTSPTFNLLEIYESRLPMYHFDLYRIECADELDQLFFEEYWEGDGVSVIEWPEIAIERLPENHYKIYIEYLDEDRRSITFENSGD